MSRHRLVLLLAAVVLTTSILAGSAWAHSGHESMGGAAAEAAVNLPWAPTSDGEAQCLGSGTSRHHVPSAVALIAGLIAVLAGLPQRRCTVAFVLCVALALAAFEGAAHAALHLQHVPHADDLAIGTSATQQAAADLDNVVPTVSPVAQLGVTIERDLAPVADATIASNQGRAPPILPA